MNNRKYVFYVWDCDYKKQIGEGNQHNISFILPLEINQRLNRGIEASFSQTWLKIKDVDLQECKDNSGDIIGHGIKNKNKVEKYISRNATRYEFRNFELLFKRISEVCSGQPKPDTFL